MPISGFSQVKPGDKEIIAGAEKVIKKYHSGADKANNVVKVVYFHGSDRQPLANWNERLDRTLTAVNNFYIEEFKRFGIKTDGVNFERSGKKYVITVIAGDQYSKAYDVNSGALIQSEIARKAAGKIDFANDHVLVLTGLTYQRDDGVYVFHSPYMGTGSSERGVCYASDNELLDPKLLTDTVTRMRFTERANMFKECGVAEFNSWYIGGIAHEMGHMFGLYHDFGNPAELTASTISLMGEYGSRHFGGYLWGDKTSRISAAGILQLLSHPVFTKSRREINTHTSLTLSDINLQNQDNGIQFKANISGSQSPYALTVLVHSVNANEYFNESSIYPIAATGPLNILLKKWPAGVYRATLMFMFPNGTLQVFNKLFDVSGSGAELLNVPGVSTVDIKEYYTRLSKSEKTPQIKLKLKILEDIIKAAPPVDATAFKGDSLYLSDAKWEVANVGWEKPARNYFTTEAEQTFFLENQGQLFEKGIFAHSPSTYTFRLNKKWNRFSAVVGLRDFAHQQGSAKFTVIGDGKVLYESPALRVGEHANVNIDIKNVKVIELKANGTEGHNFNSWASWFNPLLGR
ncbi:hypothetical protein GCM10023149_43650 [Mucilaginibacter gynuensis]|uniref:Glycosyl hydrolase family 98 putative carbohydrate-binding module domain-containing protein n=1 Tax=Mucilaginibacter gynuensis TaxID=1302236 RepID=A0ABP8H7U7_9SPHI